jgi:23S rRNA-/tRNA-specific pseudouridylate synthase
MLLLFEDNNLKISLKYYGELYNKDNEFPVHRLDKCTGGLICNAKNLAAQEWLKKQFFIRKVHKLYLGINENTWKDPEGTIDMPLRYSSKTIIDPSKGKRSITKFRKYQDNLTEFQILTGRTHQIRAHCAGKKNPILGDSLYGLGNAIPEKIELTSVELGFLLPFSNKWKLFSIKNSVIQQYKSTGSIAIKNGISHELCVK